LEGVVLAVSTSRGVLAFQDDSGAALVEMYLQGQDVQPGQRVVLEGNCVVAGARLTLGNPPLVDNNGLHVMLEKSGAIFLKAGKHSVRVSWFNRLSPSGLEVYYQGPELPRQRVPAAALFRPTIEPVSNALVWTNGLDYRAYEGDWPEVPDSTRLATAKQGSTANFDTGAGSRTENIAVDFTGFVEVPQDGVYTFSTISDDGSLLFIDEQRPCLEVIGAGAVPLPCPIAARQLLREDQQDRWAQVEGTVTFASEQTGGLELELSSGTGRMRVEVADGAGASPLMLLHSRVRALGICQSTYTTDGQTVAGALLTPSLRQIETLEVAPSRWDEYPPLPISALTATNLPRTAEVIVHLRGRTRAETRDGLLRVEDETGSIAVETTQPRPRHEGAQVEVLGRWSRPRTKVLLRSGVYREFAGKAEDALKTLPLLSTVEQVKRLSREEAQRGYPVKIRGVVTAPQLNGFFIQDSTWAIYVRLGDPANMELPKMGDYCEFEGVTFAEFAPNVRAHRVVRLGAGTLPEPLHPTWDQLINGSLDTQYVEVQGIVTEVDSHGLALLTRAGKIKVQLSEEEQLSLKQYENALIRVRGCVIPGRNLTTQEVELGHIRLCNFSINVDEPPPADPFAANLKRSSDLLLFDVRAGAIERVKLAGQVVHARAGEFFLMEGTNGLRFVPKAATELQIGDQVEVVGFADLGGPSPVLREAVVRRTSHSALPPAQPLTEDFLLENQHDATLVRLEARLAHVSQNRSDQVLELQAGTRGFLARLDTRHGLLPNLLPGSRLRLTGVFAGKGGGPAAGRNLDSFELLLNAPADIHVLERPSWWTLRHTLSLIAAMALLILGAVVWITLLHRQVEERSHQLTAEIERREQTERQRALEQERTRIARDLHDDLGATLTQIRFLSALESRDAQVPPPTRTRMGQVSEKSREMVASLDEIVWAVNPANDSLPQLATYLCQFAEEFFRSTSIRCRLDVADALPQLPLTSEVRHNLYLAVREALNNIAKHSEAAEVWLRIQWQSPSLRISIEDNGRGFSHLAGSAAGDGLVNMRGRLEKIGGSFQCATQPGSGTVCRIELPLQ
jgi:signal transduction histidine kinase